jgi:hypothetical protein
MHIHDTRSILRVAERAGINVNQNLGATEILLLSPLGTCSAMNGQNPGLFPSQATQR